MSEISASALEVQAVVKNFTGHFLFYLMAWVPCLRNIMKHLKKPRVPLMQIVMVLLYPVVAVF